MTDTLPAIAPSYSSNGSISMRVLNAAFGDGYTQRAADGLNSISKDWTVTWTARPDADISTVKTFLDAKFGFEAFFWTPPNDSVRKFVCADYSETPVVDGFSTLNAQFEEVFDI